MLQTYLDDDLMVDKEDEGQDDHNPEGQVDVIPTNSVLYDHLRM